MKVGVIAEDRSDVHSIDRFIYLITKKRVDCKPFTGRGCTKIPKKSLVWAKQSYLKGCKILIIVRDSDTSNIQDIKNIFSTLQSSLSTCPYRSDKYIITVPIQELEAWLLCDTKAIMKALKLPKEPKVTGNIEDINSPKEKLGDLIYRISKKIYTNTIDNNKIVENIDIKKILQKCPSFRPFHDFVKLNIK